MYLINKKTGLAEPQPEDGKTRPSRASSLFRKQPAPVPGEYSRTSDRKPRKTTPAVAGEYSRTSDRKPATVARAQPGAKREKPAQSAKAYAVWLLSRQDYSAASLRRKLASRAYEDSEIEDAMGFVIDNRYQDDQRYAEQRSRGAENRAGNLRIEMTLRQKGIEADLAKSQVKQLAPEEQRVLHAVGKFREPVRRDGLTQPLKLKIYRFLAYRGFSSKAIRIGIESLGADGSSVEGTDGD